MLISKHRIITAIKTLGATILIPAIARAAGIIPEGRLVTFIVCGAIVGGILGFLVFSLTSPDTALDHLTDPNRPTLNATLVLTGDPAVNSATLRIHNSGNKIATGLRISLEHKSVGSASKALSRQFLPAALSQIQPQMDIDHHLLIFDFTNEPFSLDVTLEFGIPEKPNADYTSIFRYYIPRGHLRAGSYNPSQSLHDGTKPKYFSTIATSAASLFSQAPPTTPATYVITPAEQDEICILLKGRILPQTSAQRRYIYDLGQIDGNRLSLFVADKNRLTFAVASPGTRAKSVSILLPATADFEIFEARLCLTTTNSRIRISHVGGQVAEDDFPLPTKFTAADPLRLEIPSELLIGADLKGQNSAAFDFVRVSLFDPKDSDHFSAKVSELRNRSVSEMLTFKGKQWMRRLPNGLLSQDVPALQPTSFPLTPQQQPGPQ